MTLMGALVSATIVTAQTAPAEKKPRKAPPTPEEAFAKADTNSDGQLSKEEFKAFFEASHKPRKEASAKKEAVVPEQAQ